MSSALAETGATIIFVTHDAEEALMIADRLAILQQGKLLQEAAPREAYDHPASADAAAALGPVNLFSGQVERGRIVTPFGDVPAPNLREGAAAQAVVRLEAIALSTGADVRVLERRPHGAHDVVQIESQGVVWRALISPHTPTGETASASLQAAGSFAFASGD